MDNNRLFKSTVWILVIIILYQYVHNSLTLFSPFQYFEKYEPRVLSIAVFEKKNRHCHCYFCCCFCWNFSWPDSAGVVASAAWLWWTNEWILPSVLFWKMNYCMCFCCAFPKTGTGIIKPCFFVSVCAAEPFFLYTSDAISPHATSSIQCMLSTAIV